MDGKKMKRGICEMANGRKSVVTVGVDVYIVLSRCLRGLECGSATGGAGRFLEAGSEAQWTSSTHTMVRIKKALVSAQARGTPTSLPAHPKYRAPRSHFSPEEHRFRHIMRVHEPCIRMYTCYSSMLHP